MLEKMERVSTASTALVRRTRSKAEKRQIVEETQREGASVRSVARAHEIPANQLFHWRKLYREGLLGSEAEGQPLDRDWWPFESSASNNRGPNRKDKTRRISW